MIFKSSHILSMMAAAAVAAIMFTGCAGAGDEPAPDASLSDGELRPMDFSVGFKDEPVPGIPTPVYTPLEEVFENFAVYAYKTMPDASTQHVLMHDNIPYEVEWVHRPYASSPGSWAYDITSDGYEQNLRYWDYSARGYNFSAISPYHFTDPVTGEPASIADAPYYATISSTGAIKLSAVHGNLDPALAIDWLVASHHRSYDSSTSPTTTDTDLLATSTDTPLAQPTDLTDVVGLRFHHMMTAVEFRAYNTEGTTISISEVIIKIVKNTSDNPLDPNFTTDYIYTTAGYDSSADTSTDPWGHWDYPSSDTPDARSSALFRLQDRTIMVNGSDKETSNLVTRLLEVPQDVTGLYVDITIVTKTGDKRGTFPIGAVAKSAWLEGYKYVYYLVLTDNEEIIMVNVDIDEYNWVEGNDINVNDDITNW